MPGQPQLLSVAVMVREDQKALFVRHAAGPLGGRWTLPLIGVADDETAEDALERLMRDVLHIEPGPYEFLDTVYVSASGDERFIANGFTCVGWEGEPRFPASLFDDALWAPPSDAAGLDLVPEMREWFSGAFVDASGGLAPVEYDGAELNARLADACGDLLVAFEAIPPEVRGEPLDEGGWSALDVLAHAADVEAYYYGEVRRCVEEPGRAWRLFNAAQWEDFHRLRGVDDESVLRERLDAVRHETRQWLTYQPPEVLATYIDHPERGVVQAGDRVAKIATHDRAHAEQLQRMAQAASMRSGADRFMDDETEDQP